jgi:hypothetical protein
MGKKTSHHVDEPSSAADTNYILSTTFSKGMGDDRMIIVLGPLDPEPGEPVVKKLCSAKKYSRISSNWAYVV